MAEAMVSTVSSGEHRVVSDVGHIQLCFARPDVVVQAILDAVQRWMQDKHAGFADPERTRLYAEQRGS